MEAALKQALVKLLVAPQSETERMFREVDGDWWNSKRRVPDKFLVLKRNYDLSENRLPTPVPFERTPPYRLTMPKEVAGFTLAELGQLQIHPGQDMQSLPAPHNFILRSSSRSSLIKRSRRMPFSCSVLKNN